MINVLIIDDHKMVIDGLELMLASSEGIRAVGTALSAMEGIQLAQELNPDIVLLDINLPDANGIEVCKTLKSTLPEVKVIALTMHRESSLIKLMLQNGAKGYVLKNAGQEEVLKAIRTVYEGKTYLEETVNNIVIQSLQASGKQPAQSSPFPSLSRREREILSLILKEHTTQEIAELLFISFGTVETHRRNMLIKTGARNTAGLVRIAIEYNLLEE